MNRAQRQIEDRLMYGDKEYLVSKSIRDCRTGKRQKIVQRVPAKVGITGGYVAGARDDNFIPSETRKQRRTREYFARKNS